MGGENEYDEDGGMVICSHMENCESCREQAKLAQKEIFEAGQKAQLEEDLKYGGRKIAEQARASERQKCEDKIEALEDAVDALGNGVDVAVQKTLDAVMYYIEILNTLELKEKAPLCWEKLQQVIEKISALYNKDKEVEE